jgi:hypothetical protein
LAKNQNTASRNTRKIQYLTDIDNYNLHAYLQLYLFLS